MVLPVSKQADRETQSARVPELSQRKAKELNIIQRDNRIEEPTRLKQDVLEHLERPAPNVESPAKTP
jgi:general secretion pathway protein D